MSVVSERVDPASQALELRHLRGFVAVAEELNFRRAAERLYITQPALTRQIQSLERLIGCQLLIRSSRMVRLTLAGEALLDRTRPGQVTGQEFLAEWQVQDLVDSALVHGSVSSSDRRV